MFPILLCCKVSGVLAAPSKHTTIDFRVICIFFVTAFLSIGQVKAQEKHVKIDPVQGLHSQEAFIRRFSAEALGNLGAKAIGALPDLIAMLKDKDEDLSVRASAASALGKIGLEAADEVVPALRALLNNQDNYVRGSAAAALGETGPGAIAAVPDLITLLTNKDDKKDDKDVDVRDAAAEALGKVGAGSKDAVSALIAALDDKENTNVRSKAAAALGNIGAGSKDAMSALIAALYDREESVQLSAAEAIEKIAKALFHPNETGSVAQLNAAYEALIAHPKSEVKEHAKTVKNTIDYLEALLRNRPSKPIAKVIEIITYNPKISIPAIGYLLLQFIWLLCFWLQPLFLLKVITSSSRTGEKFKIPTTDIRIRLQSALVLPLFHYRPRLLDAWVRNHMDISKAIFEKGETVAQRNIYVPMPVLIDEQMRENLSAAVFRPIFDKKKVTVLITGEGGAGKTSLACRLAMWSMADEPEKRLCKTHRMLPVLLEGNLPEVPENKDALVEAIRRGLQDMIGEPGPVHEELLLHLLRKGRVLVIVDSLSELNEATRKSVSPPHPDSPIAAMIVTSRNDQDLDGASKTVLRPLRLKSDRLSTFMDRYLEQLGKRDLFNDEEYFDACRRLSQLVSDRDITILIAKLYAEQMIAAKEAVTGAQSSAHELPRNLPDLMLGYIKRLNDQVQADKQEIDSVVSSAKIIAWECLKQTCRPITVKRTDALQALGDQSFSEVLLKYIEKRLQLIQTTGPISELVRFSLDPLAEYLAALYLVERCGKREYLWKEFFERVKEQPGAPKSVEGFLLAVGDCCTEKGNEYSLPDWVKDELARLSVLDPDAIDVAQLKQQ